MINATRHRDLRLFVPLTLVLIMFVLFLTFRNLRGVALPLLTVAMSTTCTMGLLGLLQKPMSLVMTILPPLLIAIGSSYSIHVLSHFNDSLRDNRGSRAAATAVLRDLSMPVAMTALTTIVGFGSLLANPIPNISKMAVLAGKQYFRLLDPEGTEEALAEMMYYGLGRVRGQPKSHAEFTWIVGADYEIPRAQIFTSSQLLVTERFSHEEYYTQGETDVNYSFLLQRSFMDDHLSASLTGLAQFMSGSVWLGPSVSYTPPFTEDLQLGARLNIFAGDEFSTVGMYKNQSSLVLTMRWLF